MNLANNDRPPSPLFLVVVALIAVVLLYLFGRMQYDVFFAILR